MSKTLKDRFLESAKGDSIGEGGMIDKLTKLKREDLKEDEFLYSNKGVDIVCKPLEDGFINVKVGTFDIDLFTNINKLMIGLKALTEGEEMDLRIDYKKDGSYSTIKFSGGSFVCKFSSDKNNKIIKQKNDKKRINNT